MQAIEKYRNLLTKFERDIIESIKVELNRLNRSVGMEEFPYSPFGDAIAVYIKSIAIRENYVIVNTDFNDITEKELSACIHDDEITYWETVLLLEFLQKTK